MMVSAKGLAEVYTSALREYLSGAGEAAFRRAYELGRRALAEGLGVLDLATLHQKCLSSLVDGARPDLHPIESGALNFFVESLRPYEMVFRGLQEADARLRHSLRELMIAEEALRRQNDKRMAANQAMEQERKRYHELFEFAPDAYLVTDLEVSASQVIGLYGQRMQIEESFRDVKSVRWGFKVRHVRLSECGRYERLMMVLALATLFLASVGARAERDRVHRRWMANTSRRRTLCWVMLGRMCWETYARKLAACVRLLRPAMALA